MILNPLISATTPSAPPSPVQALTRAVITALVVTAFGLTALLLLALRGDWWRAFFAASVLSVVAAAASVPVVAWGMKFGLRRPEILTATYLAAAFVRAIISLGGAVAAILLADYPKVPTLMMVVPYYLSILAAETLVVAKLLLKIDAPATTTTKKSTDSTQAENTTHA